jgi:hypothetical protein
MYCNHQAHRDFLISLYMWTYRRSAVGIVTRYGLDPVGGKIFRTRADRPGAHTTSSTVSTGSFYRGEGVKQPGRCVDNPSTSDAVSTERVELYLYSPSWPSWLVLGQILFCFYRHIATRFLCSILNNFNY